jgi:DNA-binding CsgD family transcriptional regulator
MRDIGGKQNRKAGAQAAGLKARFALSTAEAEIALALADGRGVAEIYRARCVSRHTVRSQLKSIFHKTGARTQAQLVAIVLRL